MLVVGNFSRLKVASTELYGKGCPEGGVGDSENLKIGKHQLLLYVLALFFHQLLCTPNTSLDFWSLLSFAFGSFAYIAKLLPLESCAPHSLGDRVVREIRETLNGQHVAQLSGFLAWRSGSHVKLLGTAVGGWEGPTVAFFFWRLRCSPGYWRGFRIDKTKPKALSDEA